MEKSYEQLLNIIQEQAFNKLLEAVDKIIKLSVKYPNLDTDGRINFIQETIFNDSKLQAELHKLISTPVVLKTEKFKKIFHEVINDRLIKAIDVKKTQPDKEIKTKLNIYEYIIDIDVNLCACEISYNEIKSIGINIPDKYANNPLRLIFGTNINDDKYKFEEVAFVECRIELEEWKNLSEAIKNHKEKRGEKKDTEWILCSEKITGDEVNNIIKKLTAIDQKFEDIEYHMSGLIDGIHESFEYSRANKAAVEDKNN